MRMAKSKHQPSMTSEAVMATSGRPTTQPRSDVSPLHVGDPSFSTPQFIVDAQHQAVLDGYTHYAPNPGDPELRDAVAASLTERSKTERSKYAYSRSNVIVTGGGSPAITAAILAAVDPEDRVLIPEPTYSLYADSTRLAGGTVDFIAPGADGRINLAAVEKRAAGAKMIVLCHPGNPTGMVYTESELKELGAIAVEHDLLVLSDEAYDHIVFSGVDFVSALAIEDFRDRLIYCQTLSKTYAMTGWRVGYVAAPENFAEAIGIVHRTFSGPVNSSVQRAALAAVTSQSRWPAERLTEYERRRDLTVRALSAIPGVTFSTPEGGFYVLVKYPQPVDASTFVAHALRHGVAVRTGTEFGPSGEHHIRISFCGEDPVLEIALQRLTEALSTEVSPTVGLES